MVGCCAVTFPFSGKISLLLLSGGARSSTRRRLGSEPRARFAFSVLLGALLCMAEKKTVRLPLIESKLVSNLWRRNNTDSENGRMIVMDDFFHLKH